MDSTNPKERLFIKFSDVQSFYLGFVIIFLCTGFLYNLIFFRLFGIRVEFFFTLQDYISSSIEKVYMIFLAVLIASGSSHIVRYLLREKKALQLHQVLRLILYIIPMILCFAGIISINVYDNALGYYFLALTIYICFDYVLFRIYFRGHHESYKRFFFISVFLLYLLIIGSTIIWDRDAIYKEPLDELKRYRIQFSNKIILDQKPLVLMEANSNYYFFYNKSKQRSIVIDRNLVELVENLR